MALRNVGGITGVVGDADSHVPLRGAAIRLRGTALGTVVGPDGHFTLDSVPPGTYEIECTCAEYELYRHPTIAVRPGEVTKVTCRPHREQRLTLNEPIVLLPLRLEIRRHVAAGSPLPIARYGLKEPEPQVTRSCQYREFLEQTPVEQVSFQEAEYWIRWFPDELHNWNYVGRFTEEEKEAWNRFHARYQKQRDADSRVKELQGVEHP